MDQEFVLSMTSDSAPGLLTYTLERRETGAAVENLRGPNFTGIVQIAMALRAARALPETVIDGIERLNGWYRLEMHMTEDAADRFARALESFPADLPPQN